MATIRIVTDSASDIPKALLDAHHIDVVPLTIRFGTEEFTDGLDLSSAEFWKRCGASKVLPETAAPAPGAFQAAFERAAADGCDGVVAITLSSELSSTFQSATLGAEAAAATIPVRVVDSRLVTAAEGLMVLDAAVTAEGGATLDAVEARARAAVARGGLVGTIDSLDHLVKSGRVSGAKALMGSLLSVKPVLVLRDGLVVEDGRQRTRARALEHLAQRVESLGPLDWLAVAGGGADDLDVVVTRLAAVAVRHPMIVTEIGPVVGTHGGPGTVGVCWLLVA